MKKMFFAFCALVLQGSLVWATGGLTPTRYIQYQGLNVALYDSGGHHGFPILMVHGNTSSANSYARVMDSDFARYHRVTIMDLPGYGRSQNAPSYNLGFLAGAIKAAAQATGADHGVIVGWSLGGDLTLQASTGLPNVKGYFLFGTAPFGVTPELPPPFLSPEQSYAGQAVTYGANPNLTTQQINDYVTAFFRPNYNQIANFFFVDGQRTDPGTRGAVLNVVLGNDPTFQDEAVIVRNMQVPIALLLAKKDAFVNPAYMAGLAPQIPNLWRDKIISVAGGHASHWEKTDRFVTLLEKFVDDL